MPRTIETLRGSCVTIPCSFDIQDKYKSNLDHTCTAIWFTDNEIVFDSKTDNSATTNGKLIGDLTKKDCTTTLNTTQSNTSKRYVFRLECQNKLKYTFSQKAVDISVKGRFWCLFTNTSVIHSLPFIYYFKAASNLWIDCTKFKVITA